MDIKKYMGMKIKEYRKALKLTTMELGSLSGTSQSTISEIERGTRSIQVESLSRICNALGVTLNDVLPISASQEKTDASYTPEINQLTNLISSLSSDEVRLLTDILLKVNRLPQPDRESLKSLLNSLMNNKL
ncbi:helix-turn-helix domain-containing protein [Priestia megaterium]|jgi:transcriptional regulator with XRE-family HTH domain|uniref:helix-turn-helix domain-containing protein n=1 Tax=Priestia megaterium TaxID=1404 RepID=UPI000BF2FDE7|nr:helix-turn-helix domain-containing protein [Priestia megaterium]PFU61817.1 transcriptional regulator [Priestia megaterium]RFB20729.1 XRE family transcriptional regulator [Bacillus sp. ALD]